MLIEKREFDYLRRQFRPVALHLLKCFADELCVRIRETNDQIESFLVDGKSEQRGGPVIFSARNQTPHDDEYQAEASRWSRFISLFKS